MSCRPIRSPPLHTGDLCVRSHSRVQVRLLSFPWEPKRPEAPPLSSMESLEGELRPTPPILTSTVCAREDTPATTLQIESAPELLISYELEQKPSSEPVLTNCAEEIACKDYGGYPVIPSTRAGDLLCDSRLTPGDGDTPTSGGRVCRTERHDYGRSAPSCSTLLQVG